MRLPDWRTLALNEGILPEPMPDSSRIVLWLPGGREGGFEHWERISNTAHADITVEQGMCATAATSIRARQPLRGFFGKLAQRFRKTSGNGAWMLPNGESAEQWGERQTDLLLVWAKDENTPLDETHIQSRWPESKRYQKIGKNLYLVFGVEGPGTRDEAVPLPPQGCPNEVAEGLLAAARQSGDRRKEVSALTDLGVILLHAGSAQRAVAVLQEALALARQLGDRSGEGDVLGNLGLAALAVGQPQHALELFDQELGYARAAGDRFAEKAALERLGLASSTLRDPTQALGFFEQALALAREVGDHKHEAELLWSMGIQHAELGQRDQALVQAQAAVDLFRKMGKPQADWFADYLQRYRLGETSFGLGGSSDAGPAESPSAFLGGTIMAGFWAPSAGQRSAQDQAGSGPSLLRMAFSAAKSMARYLGSGLKTVSPQTLQRRLRTCAACEHHTGLRCRLCGCFTNVKARLPHEECPIGKWPA